MNQGFQALPSLNALRVFEAVTRLNFRLAAEELGVTQGAVAQHIRGLEASGPETVRSAAAFAGADRCRCRLCGAHSTGVRAD